MSVFDTRLRLVPVASDLSLWEMVEEVLVCHVGDKNEDGCWLITYMWIRKP